MQPFFFAFSPLWAAMILMMCSAAAAAGETGQISALATGIDGAPQPASTHAGSPGNFAIAFGQPLDPGTLSALRGGYDAENSIDVDGTVDGNTANGVIAGANTISDGAFANANGLSTVIQNSGSNVLIQNAMIVKVDFGGSGP